MSLFRVGLCAAFLVALSATLGGTGAAQTTSMALTVDASDAARGILRATLTLPVAPGPLALAYPKWIPGTHGPTGRIASLMSLSFRQDGANGAVLSWERDLDDPFVFHVAVPAGTTQLTARYDFRYATSMDSTTSALAVLEWGAVVLYPRGAPAAGVRVTPSLRTPAGWRYGTALAVTRRNGTLLEFAPVSLERLVDSPVAMGAHARRWVLWSQGEAVNELDAFSDTEAALAITPHALSGYKNLVREAAALFRSRHWQTYHFLYALSEQVAHFGLEHHESSDNRAFENTLTDPEQFALGAALLAHEYVHSWNGKYRRPAGLATPNFNVPMQDDLLWVYEGLTNYYGEILSFRSGLRALGDAADFWAEGAAALDVEPGRKTRSLQDTAVMAAGARGESREWSAQNRAGDYYPEGSVIWYEADQIIRSRSAGARSLDDFARRFFGGHDTAPRVVPYTRVDLIHDLNATLRYDWGAFFRERVDTITPRLPSGGLDLAGRRLTYSAAQPRYMLFRERQRHRFDARYSLGLIADPTGKILEVLDGSPAARAGLGPEMQILAIDDRRFTFARAHAAIAQTAHTTVPLKLIVREDDFVRTAALDYHGGERYPHLAAVPGRADRFLDPFRPLRRGTP